MKSKRKAKKSKTKLVYVYAKQIGKSNRKKDSIRKALQPGKRISKNGKVYYERRKNHSDIKGKKL